MAENTSIFIYNIFVFRFWKRQKRLELTFKIESIKKKQYSFSVWQLTPKKQLDFLCTTKQQQIC